MPPGPAARHELRLCAAAAARTTHHALAHSPWCLLLLLLPAPVHVCLRSVRWCVSGRPRLSFSVDDASLSTEVISTYSFDSRGKVVEHQVRQQLCQSPAAAATVQRIMSSACMRMRACTAQARRRAASLCSLAQLARGPA